MLISVTLENWMSFRDKTTFSMVASRERQHGHRVSRLKKYKTKILPTAAVYGGNASGKTNLCKAFAFAQHLIVEGSRVDVPIPVEPFQLAVESISKPTRFQFELYIDDDVYNYSFSITSKEVLEEKLVLVKAASEQVLYHHRGKKLLTLNVHNLKKRNKDKSIAEAEIKFVFDRTRDNQLFLTNCILQNIEDYRPVYDWFKDKLVIVAPYTRIPFDIEIFPGQKKQTAGLINLQDLLSEFDTGINALEQAEYDLERRIAPIDVMAIKDDLRRFPEGKPFFLPAGEDRIVVALIDGKLRGARLVPHHKGINGDVPFRVDQESSGTLRLIDLLPVLLHLRKAIKERTQLVYVIDELDQSLHTHATRRFLELFLSECTNDTSSQLIFSTHDVMLMDQELLRRDEIWVTERNSDGSTELLSFSDYKDIRYDKDIRKSYLQGRLGGTPIILLNSA